MDAKELIKAGKLAEARKHLTDAVKSAPGNIANRTMLFQVLACGGEWDKARRHLEAIATQDSSRQAGVLGYLNVLQAEAERSEVFRHRRAPAYWPERPAYSDQYEIAREKIRTQDFAGANQILEDIARQRPAVEGTLNGKPVAGFHDTDSQLAFFLEAFVHERYVWIALESLREVVAPPPATFLDLLWISAHVTTRDGMAVNCFLPVLYPETFLHDDDRMKLGRMTDWLPLGGGLFKGVGQHVFQAGDTEIGILEIREANFTRERQDEASD
jgi:type VI secretion system protein ImpE